MRKLSRGPRGSKNTRCGKFRYTYYQCPVHKTLIRSWVPPNASRGEGPADYGLRHPTCLDMARCGNHKLGNESRSFKYLCVEFARDVELPCPSWNTTTTQETTAHYLQHANRTGSTACIASAGFHDLAVNGTLEVYYIQNVLDYLQLLKPSCSRLLWLGMSATLDDPQYPQQNDLIQKWNEALYETLQQQLPYVFVLDVWGKSQRGEHQDNVHLVGDYYEELYQFLFQNVTTVLPI